MKVDAIPIRDILKDGREYVIPPYQRPYRWDPEKAVQLIDDVLQSCDSEESEFFIGSIICVKKDGSEQHEVVDGQQRLITLTLIFWQLAELIGGNNRLSNRYLLCDDDVVAENNYMRPLLEVRRTERLYYAGILTDVEGQRDRPVSGLSTAERVYYNNWRKIADRLTQIREERGQQKLDKLARYILGNVFVVFLTVNDRMSSFRLFNVLNDRGMRLSTSDLLKSKLFDAVSGNKANSDQIELVWLQIEELVQEEDLDGFLTINQISEKIDRDRVRQKNDVYYLKRVDDHFQGDTVQLAHSLRSSAECYRNIMDNAEGSQRTKGAIANLVRVAKVQEWMPVFIAYHNRGYAPERFGELVQLSEKIFMQNLLLDVSASKRSAHCYFAIEAMNKGEPLDAVLKRMRNNVNQTGFVEALDKRDFYDVSRSGVINLIKSVLLCIEDNLLDNNIPRDLRKITIEHVLPQNMADPYWQSRFSQEQHGEWLHKLGNLALLPRGKNAAARNYAFDKKKEAYERANKKSNYETTRHLCEYDEWTLASLEERHEFLKGQIKQLWLIDTLV